MVNNLEGLDMTDRLKNKVKKLNNRGSSLVVVIIVISFVCILGTLLLYLSVMNYQMKSNDYKTRVSFYGAEEPLEELRVQLAVDMSQACEQAYIDVMTQYASLVTSDMRSTEYVGAVFREIKETWDGRTGAGGGGTTDWVAGIEDALHHNSDYCVITGDEFVTFCGSATCTCPYHIIVMDMSSGNRLEFDETTGSIILNDIRVIYTENDFVSVITTDFYMAVPEYNWDMQQNINVAGSVHTVREKIDYEKAVVYLNYTKQ